MMGLLSSLGEETDGAVGDEFGFTDGPALGVGAVTVVGVVMGVEMGFVMGLLSSLGIEEIRLGGLEVGLEFGCSCAQLLAKNARENAIIIIFMFNFFVLRY